MIPSPLISCHAEGAVYHWEEASESRTRSPYLPYEKVTTGDYFPALAQQRRNIPTEMAMYMAMTKEKLPIILGYGRSLDCPKIDFCAGN
jgi:hypothetical protein